MQLRYKLELRCQLYWFRYSLDSVKILFWLGVGGWEDYSKNKTSLRQSFSWSWGWSWRFSLFHWLSKSVNPWECLPQQIKLAKYQRTREEIPEQTRCWSWVSPTERNPHNMYFCRRSSMILVPINFWWHLDLPKEGNFYSSNIDWVRAIRGQGHIFDLSKLLNALNWVTDFFIYLIRKDLKKI